MLPEKPLKQEVEGAAHTLRDQEGGCLAGSGNTDEVGMEKETPPSRLPVLVGFCFTQILFSTTDMDFRVLLFESSLGTKTHQLHFPFPPPTHAHTQNHRSPTLSFFL